MIKLAVWHDHQFKEIVKLSSIKRLATLQIKLSANDESNSKIRFNGNSIPRRSHA